MPDESGQFKEAFAQAARLIAAADSLIITAGAGMGVDSALPDFRGPKGFWAAYPALGRAGMRFEEVASPDTFRSDPRLAWGFYGHRLALYRETVPHAGFGLLLQIAEKLQRGAFVFTSNVDGQFQKAGFDEERIVECHGSIHHLQCCDDCSEEIWSAWALRPKVDAHSCTLDSALPHCPRCNGLARPNILMFGDWGWNPRRTSRQQQNLKSWQREVERPVVIEMGAGINIATVRAFSEAQNCPLIRINPAAPQLDGATGVEVPVGACKGVTAICAALDRLGFFSKG